MRALAVLAAVACVSPHLSFREFYAREHPELGGKWALRYEETGRVNARIADSLADYADYAVSDRRCGDPENGSSANSK